MSLPDDQRKRIHDFALTVRSLLTQEASQLLEGVYGLYADGHLDPPHKLPQVQSDPENAETYGRLVKFLDDEHRAGLPRPEAVEKLVKEVAFTHVNRLVAFKMMESRRLIRGTLNRGVESNAFKFYLADPAHAGDLALHGRGEVDIAYRHFLLWQAGQVAQELRVLFDPDTLASRLFPRPRALQNLLELLNHPGMDSIWGADETVGWVYQFFNEEEKAAVNERVNKQKEKIRRQDIPAATQLFTPNWIVRYLVQNSLGRLWVQMHPDTRLLDSDLLDYLIEPEAALPPEPLRPVGEITLLDPACGAMHFGLVAFDLFAAMYQEELEQAGEPGWPQTASVQDAGQIPGAIIARNLFGIDIDLRAVQLSALTLYLKAKSLDKDAAITESNLACADVLPLGGADLDAFFAEMRFTQPIYERLMRALWEKLVDVNQLGSLLRVEQELTRLIQAERARYAAAPLFAGMPGEFESEAAQEEFWHLIAAQIIQGLDAFARSQAAKGVDQHFFTGEAVKGLRLLDVMLRKYDVVVTNPPYRGKRDLNDVVASYLDSAYPSGKGDIYAAFMVRCAEFLEAGGRLGMIVQQSFMFISSYANLRAEWRGQFAIENMAHTGTRAFAEIPGEKVNTTAFTLRAEPDAQRRDNNLGVFIRLVHAGEGDGKRLAFEQALRDGSNRYAVAQRRFDAIPGSPWAYWVKESIRQVFETYSPLSQIVEPKMGMGTRNNFRYLRFWWEIGLSNINRECRTIDESISIGSKWFPYMKGGRYRKWYGNQEYIVNFQDMGLELKTEQLEKYPYLKGTGWIVPNEDVYFHEGITWGDLNPTGFAVRYSPGGFVFDVKGSSGFPPIDKILGVLALMNSSWMQYALDMLNPTASFQIGDIARVPIPELGMGLSLTSLVGSCISLRLLAEGWHEATYSFTLPKGCSLEKTNPIDTVAAINQKQTQIDSEIYKLYRFSKTDVEAISSELRGESITSPESIEENVIEVEDEGSSAPDEYQDQELIIRWISYAIGIILGRFQPGIAGSLGSAIYRRADFAVGSLPAPEDAEFDELVGPPEHFAYVDGDGGRHVFSAEIETALRALAVADGITVLDEGHPRDLPALVQKALDLMLGAKAAQEVVAEGAGGDLRKFLERDFFTKWHVKGYRSRPIYWYLQSARRSYGFVVFHEKIDRYFLYTLQRDYLDYKRNSLEQQIEDLTGQMAGQAGPARKRLERQIDKTRQILDEIAEFAQSMEAIVRAGYEPDPNWIDDGVILRMAPLWELVPIWKSEPKKYWERLERGDFDWAHLALRYWPQRVQAACRVNKSYAIAHGHEEWYEGGA